MPKANHEQEKVKKSNLRSKSYFNKYLKSFMMILFVPMVTIILVFWQTNNIVREQITSASQNTLKQFFGRMDAVGEAGKEMCLSIGKATQCRAYSEAAVKRPDETSYVSWELHNYLASYSIEKYYDVFVYFPSNNSIVSATNMTMPAEKYYQSNYGNEGHDYWDEFQNILMSATKIPKYYSMNGTGVDSYLCIALQQGMYMSEEYNYIVVAVLKPGDVKQLLQEADNETQDGISMIFDSEKELLLSSSDSVVLEKLGEGFEENVPYEDVINGEKYIMQVQKSDSLRSYFAYAVSYKYFWEQLYEVYIICGIGSVMSILLGVLFAVRETRKAYEPIEQLVTNLQKQENRAYDAKVNSEFEFIDALLQNWKEDKLLVRQSVRKNEELKRNRFLLSLLEGNVEEDKEEDEKFRENGLTLLSQMFQVGILQVEENGSFNQEDIAFILGNVFQELFDKGNRGWLVNLREGKYAILYNIGTPENPTNFLTIFEEGRAFLGHYFKIKMTLGLSTVQEGVLGIHMAYKEASFALRYRYLMGKESIIEYTKVTGRKFRHATAAESRVMRMINGYLKCGGSEQNAAGLVDKIIKDYEIDQGCSMESMEFFKLEAIGSLNMLSVQKGYTDEHWKSNVMQLFQMETLKEFTELFTAMVEELAVKVRGQAESEDVCRQAQKYIEEHYMDVQLSLNLLSEVLKISPSYLSRLFKEKYQVSIPNYVTSLRMEAAKRELRTTSHSVLEIAQNNGFVDDKAFIKVFKKIEGITPGAYRKMANE